MTFETLRSEARQIAAAPYVGPSDDLHDFWKGLDYDQHRQIQFKMTSGLWAEGKGPFSIDYFHPGWTAKKTVKLHEIQGGQSTPLVFDPKLFSYGNLVVAPEISPPPGYAGWRARTHLNSADYKDEFLVFLGASYFRAVPAGAHYGLSARGLSIASGIPGVPEEFPDFTRAYMQRPVEGDKTLTFLTLLESESVTGAYQFVVTPGEETVMEIEAELTLRKPVTQLGLAPFSSMFWFGEATHPRPFDFRPEVHDSDSLLIELNDGSLQLRPLEHSLNQFRHCVFTLDKPRSWSLLQRDRSFSSYQDAEAAYHKRPSVKVEPIEGFDHGKLHLIEIPTVDETNDNISLQWEPGTELEIGKPFRFKYRLRWMLDVPPTGLFAVRSTRVGTPVQLPNQLLFTIDFAKPLHPEKKVGDPKWDDISKIKPVVTLNNSAAKLLHVGMTDLSMPNIEDLPLGLGHRDDIHMPQVLRAFYVIEPGKDVTDLDMTCELQDPDGKVLSERWLYLWKRPLGE